METGAEISTRFRSRRNVHGILLELQEITANCRKAGHCDAFCELDSNLNELHEMHSIDK